MQRINRLCPPILLALSCSSPLWGQGPAGTDIYVAELAERDGRVSVGPLTNATDRDGYDNQPHFVPSGTSILYTSGRPDGQMDIHRYDILSKRSHSVTETAESEYSPTPMPGGETFSVIRVEADSSQRLWSFRMDGTNPQLVLEEIMPVGYHAWADSTTVALFVLGSPATLQLASTRTGQGRVIERNIGRSIHKIPSEDAISFVHKVSENEWWIRRLDLRTERITPLVRTLPGSEDYAWTPHGTIIMGQNSILYQWTPGTGGWLELADLGAQGIQSITRIAVSPAGDRIAIVGSRG